MTPSPLTDELTRLRAIGDEDSLAQASKLERDAEKEAERKAKRADKSDDDGDGDGKSQTADTRSTGDAQKTPGDTADAKSPGASDKSSSGGGKG